MALGGSLVQSAPSGRLMYITPTYRIGRGHPHMKLAVEGENPMKARQICAWLGGQGGQLGDEG